MRLSRLDRLLEQALNTGYYMRHKMELPQCAPYDEEMLPVCLQAIPRTRLENFLTEPAEFYNWSGLTESAVPLETPLATSGRTAVLSSGIEESEMMRSFNHLQMDELEGFEPELLAGPIHRLQALAEATLQGRFKLESLRCAVVAFTGLKHGCMTTADRELLWRAFHVPVFEQFRGFSQELLAYECDAHEGLHIKTDNAIFEASHDSELLLTCLACREYTLLRIGTEMSGRIVQTPCGCGDSSPRLLGLTARQKQTKVMAAYA